MPRRQGDAVVDADGARVLLRGVGLGGWMNMENFITGYPANESAMRDAVAGGARAGPGGAVLRPAARPLLRPRTTRSCSPTLGVNCVRLPINQRALRARRRAVRVLRERFRAAGRARSRAAATHGIYSVIDLHAVPGCQNQHWHSDNPTHVAAFWRHPHFQDRVVHLWQALADALRATTRGWRATTCSTSRPIRAARSSGRSTTGWWRRSARSTPTTSSSSTATRTRPTSRSSASRTRTRSTPATTTRAPGWRSATAVPRRGRERARGDVPRAHALPARDRHADLGRRVRARLHRRPGARRAALPGARRPARRSTTRYGAGWSLWTYKDVGLQGLVHAAPTAPYMQRFGDFIAKKARLGDRLLGLDRRASCRR